MPAVAPALGGTTQYSENFNGKLFPDEAGGGTSRPRNPRTIFPIVPVNVDTSIHSYLSVLYLRHNERHVRRLPRVIYKIQQVGRPMERRAIPVNESNFRRKISINPRQRHHGHRILIHTTVRRLHPVLQRICRHSLEVVRRCLITRTISFNIPTPTCGRGAIVIRIVRHSSITFNRFTISKGNTPRQLTQGLRTRTPTLFGGNVIRGPRRSVRILPRIHRATHHQKYIFGHSRLGTRTKTAFLRLQPRLHRQHTKHRRQRSRTSSTLLSTLNSTNTYS